MNLTEYLFHRLRELGVGHTFGIPGDFVLPVYAVQEAVGMPTIVCAHEPGVGFAADAYARLKGLGVALAHLWARCAQHAQPGRLRVCRAVAAPGCQRRPRGRASPAGAAPSSCRQDVREPVADLSRSDGRRGDSRRPGVGPRDDRPRAPLGGEVEAARLPGDSSRPRSFAGCRSGRPSRARSEADDSPSLVGALDEAAAEIGAMLATAGDRSFTSVPACAGMVWPSRSSAWPSGRGSPW